MTDLLDETMALHERIDQLITENEKLRIALTEIAAGYIFKDEMEDLATKALRDANGAG